MIAWRTNWADLPVMALSNMGRSRMMLAGMFGWTFYISYRILRQLGVRQTMPPHEYFIMPPFNFSTCRFYQHTWRARVTIPRDPYPSVLLPRNYENWLIQDIEARIGWNEGLTLMSLHFLHAAKVELRIERKMRKFNPLVIPKLLQAALPFASKPKDIPSRRRPLLESRRAVIPETHESQIHALVQQLQLIRHEKLKKQKLKEVEKRKAREVEKAKDEQLSRKRQREERRGRYREQDKLNKRIRKNTEG
ncbi:hypothetical protein RHSIM_Rhsim08G0143400 [Rhododendron simsii]|uniref:Uncharacterized protein n=1 Tax=Rhododendron simsii TaxID=118357 RepID=A0A834LE01_RHOSS|nr:hypothetical protein RHSIM_Rhsim08G0143400 [Rhododendron simsii]